jgi:hypothetical protein
MILLFTALSSLRPFHKRDLLNVCCEAPGAQITFGYRNKWIADGLKGKPLKGEPALVVFCEVLSEKNQFKFHPIRLATVNDTLTEHDALAITITLDSFANFDRDPAQQAAFLSRFEAYIGRSDLRPHPHASGKPSKYVRNEDDFEANAFKGAWLPFIEHVKSLRGLTDATFLAAQRAVGASGSVPVPLFRGTKYENTRQTFAASGGASVELPFRMILGGDASFQIPECTLKDSVGVVTGPFVRQQSAGFEATFVVSFRHAFQNEVGMLTARVPPSAPSKYISPEHQVLIRLGVSHVRLAVTIFLLVGGTLVASIGPDSIAQFGTAWMTQHAKGLTVLSKALGAFMLASGFWMALKKLPFKG